MSRIPNPLEYFEKKNQSFQYVTPHRDTYRLMVPFYVPTDDGPIWAIALSERSGKIFAAALTVILPLIFLYLWEFAAIIAVLFRGDKKLRRQVALLSVWNSDAPWSAFTRLTHYAYRCLTVSGATNSASNTDGKRGWYDFFYGVTVALVALIIALGSTAVGIVGPSYVEAGNIAPVNPSSLYYPIFPEQLPQTFNHLVFRVPPVMRALSSADVARDTDLETDHMVGFKMSDPQPASEQPGDTILSFTYNFTVTGANFGLQHVHDLRLGIHGECRTEYSWLQESTEATESYRLWDDPNEVYSFNLPRVTDTQAPLGNFYLHPDFERQANTTGNISFAIIATSSGHFSFNEGTDPWYATFRLPEEFQQENPDIPPLRIKGRRPALSCWEQRIWQYKETTSTNFEALGQNTTKDLAKPLLEVFKIALEVPMIYIIGYFAPPGSALLCSTTSFSGYVDAARCSLEKDLKRLVLASFVATQHIFTDGTLFERSEVNNYPNVYDGEGMELSALPDWSQEIVLQTTDVTAFRLKWVITLFVVLASVALIRRLSVVVVRRCFSHSSLWWEIESLETLQLFRNLYETQQNKEDKSWPCNRSLPVWRDEREFKIEECDKKRCFGHIVVTPEVDGPEIAVQPSKTGIAVTEKQIKGEIPDLEG